VRKLRMACLIVLSAILMVGCSSSDSQGDKEEVVKNQELPEGFKGGCTGNKQITLYVQNQFKGYGATARYNIDVPRQGPTVNAGEELRATGWFDTGKSLKPSNPELIRGEVWYYVPDLDLWLADMSVRSRGDIPHARNNDSNEFTPDQAAPRPKECELTR
jgi:hypothetical protein